MLTIQEGSLRNLGENLVVLSGNGRRYRFTQVTAEEAERVKTGGILVKNGKIYICEKLPHNEKVGCEGHLCNRCSCEQFIKCAEDMGPKSNNIQNYSFIKEGIETRGTHRDQLIVISCNNYKPENARKEDSSKRAMHIQCLYELFKDIQRDKKTWIETIYS